MKIQLLITKPQPGKYDVGLTITDAKGRKDKYELKSFIELKYKAPWNLREKKLGEK